MKIKEVRMTACEELSRLIVAKALQKTLLGIPRVPKILVRRRCPSSNVEIILNVKFYVLPVRILASNCETLPPTDEMQERQDSCLLISVNPRTQNGDFENNA